MAQAHVGELPEGMKRCRICQEPINNAAQKCIHCGSDQNWKFRLGLSSTILALLVALVSVIGATAPAVRDLLTPANSNLVASYQGIEGKTLNILVSNTGTRPGTVSAGATLWIIPWSIGGFGPTLEQNEPKVVSARIVDPGKSILLAYSVNLSAADPAVLDLLQTLYADLEANLSGSKSDKVSCRAVLGSVDYRGNNRGHLVDLDCYLLVKSNIAATLETWRKRRDSSSNPVDSK